MNYFNMPNTPNVNIHQVKNLNSRNYELTVTVWLNYELQDNSFIMRVVREEGKICVLKFDGTN